MCAEHVQGFAFKPLCHGKKGGREEERHAEKERREGGRERRRVREVREKKGGE